MNLFVLFNNFFSCNAVIFFLCVAVVGSLCFGVFFASVKNYNFPTLLNPLLLFSFFLIILFIFLTDFSYNKNTVNLVLFNQHFQLIFLTLSLLVILATRDFVGCRKFVKFEYDCLLLFVFLSAVCMCFADDFFIFYLAIELQSFAFYVFATFNRNSEFSTESGLKYFIFGAIFSCFLLLGLTVIYVSFGSLSFEFISSLMYTSDDIFLFFGVFFIMLTIFFKIGAAPFHFWLTDVYDGAVTSVTLLFAFAPKIMLFNVIIKLFFSFFLNFNFLWTSLFLGASLLSVFVGSLSAIYQKRLKRLFAYSTIAHTGFLLLGLVGSSLDSTTALIFYLFVYVLMTILLFSVLIFAFLTQTNFPAFIGNWTSFGVKNPVFAITFSFTLLSIAGIPPLAGFFSKFFVLFSAITQEYYLTCLFIVIISSIGCFYYIRLIKTFFFTKTSKINLWISTPTRRFTEFNIAVLLFFNMFFCFYPDLLLLLSTFLTLILV